MPYIEEICEPLLKVLRHHSRLPTHQLAGHSANLDFWIGEVLHRLSIIDGYRSRFESMVTAQSTYEDSHPHLLNDPAGWTQRVGRDVLPKPTSSDASLKKLRREVLDVAHGLLDRCKVDGLRDDAKLDELRARLTSAGATI